MRKKPIPVMHISSYEVTKLKKPYINGFDIGHGVHGDTKYNRNKEKAQLRKMLREHDEG